MGHIPGRAGALGLIGKEALPAVLRVIKTDSSSVPARENAVFVWMDIHKYERAKGVALLKQEEVKTNDVAIKERLRWAVSKALVWCNPPDEPACRAAANPGQP